MFGKSITSWNVPAVHNGDPEKFVELLIEGKFEAVALKVADGPYVHRAYTNGPWAGFGDNVKLELVQAIKDAGIKLYLWQFLYGINPSGELDIAVKKCKEFKPDGWIWDAETSFDSKKNAESNARLLTRGLKAACPETRQSLYWWALPKSPTTGNQWHPIRVAKAFLEIVDSAMPMMYWEGVGGAAAVSYLQKSLGIWRTFTDKPLIPVGRLYTGDGGIATAEGVKAFGNSVLHSASTMNLIGNSWWSFDTVVKNQSLWDAVKVLPPFGKSIKLTIDEILERLVEAHPDLFPELED